MPHVRSKYRAYMRQLRGSNGGFCSAPRPIPPPPGLEPRVQLSLQKLAPSTSDILLDYLTPKARKSISTRVASATVVSGDATVLSVRTRVAAVSIEGNNFSDDFEGKTHLGGCSRNLSVCTKVAAVSIQHIDPSVSSSVRVASEEIECEKEEIECEDEVEEHDCDDSSNQVQNRMPTLRAQSNAQVASSSQSNAQVASSSQSNAREVYDSSSDDVDAMPENVTVTHADSELWQIGERYAAEIKDVLAHIEVSLEVLSNDVLRDKHLATQLEIYKTEQSTEEILDFGDRGMEVSDLLDELYRLHRAQDDRWHGFISRLRDAEFLTMLERRNCVGNLMLVHQLNVGESHEHIRTGTEFANGREQEIEEIRSCMDAWKDFLMSMLGLF